jgi:hypothetical protein
MNTYKKPLSVALVLVLAAASLIIMQSAQAQVHKPSVPEFTAAFVDRSYDMPEATSQNQYTGETIVTPAHRVQNFTIELTIKNQPFSTAPIQLEQGGSTWIPEFFYDVNVKGHYTQNWTIMYPFAEGPKPSNSDYTTITYELVDSEQNYEMRSFSGIGSNSITGIPGHSTLDFQVRAIFGVMHRISNGSATNILEMYPWVFDGEISDWSNTQSVTIPAAEAPPTQISPVSPAPTSTTTPYEPIVSGNTQATDLVLLAAAVSAVIAIAVVVAAIVIVRKQKEAK